MDAVLSALFWLLKLAVYLGTGLIFFAWQMLLFDRAFEKSPAGDDCFLRAIGIPVVVGIWVLKLAIALTALYIVVAAVLPGWEIRWSLLLRIDWAVLALTVAFVLKAIFSVLLLGGMVINILHPFLFVRSDAEIPSVVEFLRAVFELAVGSGHEAWLWIYTIVSIGFTVVTGVLRIVQVFAGEQAASQCRTTLDGY